jgi:L-lysine exporter family protein LysE/ArgO
MFDTSAFAQGLVLGLGMFVCPGPKDVLILRHALYRQPAFELIAIGTLSDTLLIWFGMAGASAALSQAPALQLAALWFGVGLMLSHGLIAAGRAAVGAVDKTAFAVKTQPMSRNKSVTTLVAVSFFNPVAWLDTVLVIGTVGAALPQNTQMSFALGAITASLLWFLALVVGGRSAGHLMTAPKTWQMLDAFVAVAMLCLALYIARGLL